jgi:hypothetical protein
MMEAVVSTTTMMSKTDRCEDILGRLGEQRLNLLGDRLDLR